MGDGLLSLNWNNHGATFCHTLASLRGKDKYTDVTVSCDGKFYQVHKLVLSTCSEYFEKIFENTPCKHPVIVLRDVHCEELESLLNYMYKGVVSVAQNDLSRLIKVAELLQIKGLAVPDEPPVTSKSSNKRTSDDRHSPRSNADNFSSVSPYPKRRRRRESDSYQPSTSSSSSVQQSRKESSQSWADETESRKADDRLRDTQQDRISSPIAVDVDETLIKEEIPDNNGGEEDILDDYSGLGIDPPSGGGASGDGSQDAAGGLMIPKFDESNEDDSTTAVSLPDQVVEALAGPSGLQGWADGGDMTRGLPLGGGGEGFSGGESQDMPSSVGLPTQASGQQPHQMVGMATVASCFVRDYTPITGDAPMMKKRGVKSGTKRGKYTNTYAKIHLKDIIITAAKNEQDWKAVAEANGIPIQTAYGWIRRSDEQKKKRGGHRFTKFREDHVVMMMEYLQENPLMTPKEIAARLAKETGIIVCPNTLHKYLEGLKGVLPEPAAMN